MSNIQRLKQAVLITLGVWAVLGCDDDPAPTPEATPTMTEDASVSADDGPELDRGVEDQSVDDLSVDDLSVDDLGMSDSEIPPEERFPNDPGGNPLDPTHALYPFPSDFFLEADSASQTGYRVAIPPEAMLAGVPAELIGSGDGFSRIPMILSGWPRGIDSESLPSATEHGETIEDGSTTLIIEHGTGRRIPHLAEVDRSARDPLKAPLIIRPLILLEPNQTYSVVIRNQLRDLEGGAYEPTAAFKALRDGADSGFDPIERQRDAFAATRSVIEESGVPLDEVLLAWSFHTASREHVTRDLLYLQELAHDWPLERYEITRDEVVGENRQLEGTFVAPNFVGARGFVRDADGLPTEVDRVSFPFTLTIPLSVEGGAEAPSLAEPRPVILYGHGFLGNRQQATRSSFNELCRRGRFSAAGINFGFHEEVLTSAIQGLTGSEDDVFFLLAAVSQTMVNASIMVRYIREQISQEMTALDPQAVHYMGISNGGTFGYLFGSTTLEVNRGVFVVGGAGLSHFLQRATQWNELGFIASNRYTSPATLQLFLSLLQQALDPIDPASYMDRLVEPRFEGRGPLRAQLHMARYDSQVHNLVSEWVARSARVPLITPSPKDVWGLDTVTAPLSDEVSRTIPSALYVYEEDVEPNPIGNVPPSEDNRTHNTVRDLEVYKEHVIRFIDEGVMQQVCDGACDPE